MIWSSSNPPEDPGARYRRVHSEWLTRAISTRREYPRIPVRRVEAGGFEPLLQRAHGWVLAARWWILALARVDD